MTDLNNDLTPAQRQVLVNLMLNYVNDAVVAEHPLLDHFDRHLFTHHEQYIRAMEDWLKTNGGAEFVPLPKWNPANPIPAEFNVVKARDNGTPRTPLANLNPNLPRPGAFAPAAVCAFPNTDDLGNAIRIWHNSVHGAVGGTMANFDTASAAPIFWCWHKYVNETYEDRLRCQGWTGSFIQSRFGTKGNFELVEARPRGGIYHFWRNNDAPGFPWGGGQVFATDIGDGAEQLSLVQGNFGDNLELAVRVGDRLAHFWRISNPPWTWTGSGFFATGVAGNPVLIQSSFGTRGNFEVVVPRAGGGLAHYWRDNDVPGFPWSGPSVFGTGLGQVNAVALVQSNFGGNLEVVARVGDRLTHFWRISVPPWTWHGPTFFFTGAAGGPGFIQSRHGTKGNFELVTPLTTGRMAHLWRDNDTPGFPWSGPTVFGPGGNSKISAVSLIQGNFGSPGNLEVAARIDGRTAHLWRLGSPPWTWNGPTAFV